MKILYVFTGIIAVLLTILTVGLTILSISVGGGSILLPGLGLIISLPFVILLLAAIDVVFIFLALLFRRLIKKLS